MRRKNKLWLILLMILLFLVGLVICLYPYFQGASVDAELKASAKSFYDRFDIVPPATEEPIGGETLPSLPPKEEYPELRQAMESYNAFLWQEKQSNLCDPWSYQQPSFSLKEYGLEDEIFGVIAIPKLDLYMPLYLGATESNLAAGAAHLSQTSLPIGGENTNCVIAGHRGWGGASYFRYITELQIGNQVIITNLWQTLTYTVCETKVIDPSAVDEILIQDGRDMVTLLTCHPYASNGKYRYLVYCERTQ